MMYIEKTNESKVNLMGMDLDQATALASMIRGAGLLERRTFNGILHQLTDTLSKRNIP